MSEKIAPRPVEKWRIEAQKRIDAQIAIIAGFEPGSKKHQTATEVLLLLQDSMYLMGETKAVLARIKEP